MVAFRWLVAVLVTVVTLFGGAFRAQPVVRGHLAIQSATDDAKQATLDAGRSIVLARATKPSTPKADAFGPEPCAAPSAARRLAQARPREITAQPQAAAVDAHRRRVRTHLEHMVFLI